MTKITLKEVLDIKHETFYKIYLYSSGSLKLFTPKKFKTLEESKLFCSVNRHKSPKEQKLIAYYFGNYKSVIKSVGSGNYFIDVD